MRLFFATDIHGSDLCYKKFLRTPEIYGVDALFLGGDYTSKSLVVCVRTPRGWQAIWEGKQIELATRTEVEALRTTCWNHGQLFQELSEEAFRAARESRNSREDLIKASLREYLNRWRGMAVERLGTGGVPIYQIPGNDDPLYCDDFFNEPPFVPADGHQLVIQTEGIAILGLGGSNPTPWHTPREYTEAELAHRIDTSLGPTRGEVSLIFFSHAPPWNSGLDEAPMLNADLSYRMVLGSPEKHPVGSRAVRHAVERLQPLLGLFGHVHEARGHVRIGKTLCINPGSTFQNGRLLGCIVTITRGRIVDYQLTEG